MPLDGVTLASVLYDLKNKMTDGRVDKITQPEPDEILLSIRGRGESYKLLLTANASSPRVHLTDINKISPLQAPMFCMVLRKQLSGGKLLRILQPDFERIAEFHIESLNEMGDRSVKKLVIEIMGKHSNIILLDDADSVIDAIKHVSHEISAVREILPGRTYVRPPSNGKSNPLTADMETFTRALQTDEKKKLKIQQALYQSFNGISPVMASEICARAGIAPETYGGAIDELSLERLYHAFSALFTAVERGEFFYHIYLDEKEKPVDFSAAALGIYDGRGSECFASPSLMLEAFYRQRDADYRLSQKTVDLRKLINAQTERCVKKRALYEKTLTEIKDRDRFRLYGELLTSYIHLIEKGADHFIAQNFYDGSEIEIPLDGAKTPAENAQAYFKQYNKQKRTYAALQEQIRQNDEDLYYLDSVTGSLQTVTEESDIAEIRTELAEQGFIKKKSGRKNGNQKAQKKSKPLHYVSSDGFDIYVGKNNTQNDELTLRFAQNGDIWLHTKDIAGSHVIVKTRNEQLPARTIDEAANLAAYHSKGRGSSQVPVDYAFRKYVRKPNGAKPGYVIYDHNKTAYVTPVETALTLQP